jgi:hypothetical protein
MKPKITRFAEQAGTEAAARKLEGLIRRRMSWMLKGARTRMIELELRGKEAGRFLLLTAKAMDRIPGIAQLHRLLGHLQDAVKLLLRGTLPDISDASSRLLMRSVVRDTDDFVASLVEDTESAARAVLTFGFKREQFQFLLTDDVGVLRSSTGSMKMVIKPHGGFEVR